MQRFTRVILFISAAILLNGCASLDEPPTAAKTDFRALCNTVSKTEGGKVSRQEYITAAKDKLEAEIVFDSADINRDGYLTEDEACALSAVHRRQLQQVIRFTEPHGMR